MRRLPESAVFETRPQRSIAKYVVAAGVGAAVLLLGAGSFYTVDQGYRGVVLRYGALVGEAEPGLGFKVPFIDRVKEISIQNQAKVYENVMAYSFDQQTGTLRISVNYHVPPEAVGKVYSEYGTIDRMVSTLLDRQIQKTAEEVFGQYTAVKAVQDRAQLTLDVLKSIKDAIDGPIVIDTAQVENIDFSDAYEASIEQRMQAEIEVQKVRQNADREKVQAEIKVIQAQADADARVAQAKAEAESTRLKGEGDAAAIRARGEAEADAVKAKAAALGQNPNLVQLIQAERWDGKLPSTMVPGGATPFVRVGP